jgi:hypothetical protein
MKKLWLMAALLSASALGLVPSGFARNDQPPTSTASESADAKYTQTIEKRTADILTALALKDETKTAQVHDAIMTQYRALHDWQAANESKLKTLNKQKDDSAKEQVAQIMAARKALHDSFVAKLGAVLTPEQVDIAKDKLTYNKLKVTYDAYCQIVPGLTETEKARMLELLKEAREEAIDGTSADEKSAIFKKYKGKINNYLSQQGHDVAKAYKDWGAKSKAPAETEPVK